LSKKYAQNGVTTTALIWGTAFVAQRSGMDYVGPFTFNGIRFLIGALVMIPVILIMDKLAQKNQPAVPMTVEEKKKERKFLWTGGFFCLALLAGTSSADGSGLYLCQQNRFYHRPLYRHCTDSGFSEEKSACCFGLV
jgi:hypothetical protein